MGSGCHRRQAARGQAADPLRLGKGLSLLQTEATPRKVQLDIIKISNYLARDRLCGTRIVFSDPFD